MKRHTYLTKDKKYRTRLFGLDAYRNFYAIQKLGHYEDIDDDLGIDYETLMKALKNGFYDSKGAYIKGGELYLQLCIETKRIHTLGSNEDYYFKDYGKTWFIERN